MVEIRTQRHLEVERLVEAGIAAVHDDDIKAAQILFHQAYDLSPNDPRAMSYYGYTTAVLEGKIHFGIDLCNKACLSQEATDPMIFNNLALLYIQLGKRREAVVAFKRGLKVDRGNQVLFENWKNLIGFRRRPALPFLSRDNVINRLIGRLTYKPPKNKKARRF